MKQLIPGLTERLVKPGEDYTKARKAFNVILAQYGQAAYFASRYVGGLLTSRSHKGDKDARPPISLIDPKRQRDALTLIENEVLSEKPFQFPPELYNQLGPTNWNHWGLPAPPRKDIAVHEVILACQTRVLNHLLSPTTLGRIHDAELKLPADKDTLTAAELIQRLTRSVFSELETIKEGSFTDRKPAIGSLRRNLQRAYLKQLSQLALGRSGAPEDCQTVAHAELADLKVRMDKLLGSEVKLDGYTRAHLQESASRIAKVLDAELSLPGP
jgi:hypothetical protein